MKYCTESRLRKASQHLCSADVHERATNKSRMAVTLALTSGTCCATGDNMTSTVMYRFSTKRPYWSAECLECVRVHISTLSQCVRLGVLADPKGCCYH